MTRQLHKTRFVELGCRLHEIGRLKRHRHAIVLGGDVDWGWRSAQELCEPFDEQDIILVSDPIIHRCLRQKSGNPLDSTNAAITLAANTAR